MVAGLEVEYMGGVANRQTVTATATLSCPDSYPSLLVAPSGSDAVSTRFAVTVSFQGNWSAIVSTYSAFETTSAYLHQTCDYTGSSTAYIFIYPWNPSGEQTVKVTAYKLNSGDGNLTVSVDHGAALRYNSTVSPFGSTTAFLGTAP